MNLVDTQDGIKFKEAEMNKTENPLKKWCGSFTRKESKLRELPIIGWDTEDNSRGTVTLFCFFSASGSKVTRFHKKALDYIYSIEEPTYFVAHNLEYDVVNLFKHDDYNQIEDMIYTGTRLLKMTLKGCPHTFVDSGAFFQGTLKALGKFIGKEKLEGNSMDEAYITRDAEIPYLFLTQFQHRLVTQEKVNLGMTIGQMSMEIYRRNYMLSKIQYTYNSDNCFKAYYGGRVEAFYLGTLKTECHVSDINSCYPDVMKNELYPDTGTIVPSKIDTHKFGIGKFKMYVPEDTFLPVLPHKEKRSGRLFFPVGIFTGWWTYHEVRYAIKHGAEILEEYEGEGTNAGCSPFADYIEDFYNKRLGAKAKNNSFDDLLYKLFQNNLYGKFFQWRGGNKMTRDPIPVYKLEKYFDHPDFDTKKVGPFYWYHLPKSEPPKHANFMWGLYITSYARIKLHSGLETARKAGYTPVYCDTDSIMYSNLSGKKLPDPGLKISNKLGDWDKESFDLAIFRQAKAYILYRKSDKVKNRYIPVKWACKGVPTHYAHEFIIEAIAKYLKPRRLKEALTRQNAEVNKNKGTDFIDELGANIWRDVTKEMRSIYIKRAGKEGVTQPQNASDLSELVKESISLERLDYLEEVKEYDLARPEKPAPFQHDPIPDDYFNQEPARQYRLPEIYPAKPFRLGFENMAELKKNDIWFRGIPLRYVKITKGVRTPLAEIPKKSKEKYFTQILLTELRGQKMPENFVAEINYKIIDGFFEEKDFCEKTIGIILLEDYIEKEYPKIGYLF